MRVQITDPLFAWERLEDSPSLRTIRLFLHSVPDAALLAALRAGAGATIIRLRRCGERCC